MNQSRFQKRVGVFAVICLVLVGALLLAFSKGTRMFAATYELKMQIKNVGGLQRRSSVFLAGIPIGNLKSAELAPDGRSVLLTLSILQKYPIHTDAEFAIEQIGVLGDQFVSVYPGTNNAPLLQPGAVVQGKESLNLQEVARSAADLIKELTSTLAEIREGITNVKRGVLDPQTLSNLSATISNFRGVSERTLTVVDDVGFLVRSNTPTLTQSVSNVVRFSARMETVADHLDETILTNRASLSGAISNFQATAAALKSITTGLDQGRGFAGNLLTNQHLGSDLSLTLSNLAVLSSNLNRYGLLYKPRPPRPVTTKSIYPGKTPF